MHASSDPTEQSRPFVLRLDRFDVAALFVAFLGMSGLALDRHLLGMLSPHTGLVLALVWVGLVLVAGVALWRRHLLLRKGEALQRAARQDIAAIRDMLDD